MTRWVMHVDMDAFFASVEQYRNHPELIGRPVCVGHDPRNGEGRGVVRAASYEARAKGVYSGMPVSQAYYLCPEAAFVSGSFENYARASDEFMDALRPFADSGRLRRASIDEAYLEVTEQLGQHEGPEALARIIQDKIGVLTRLPCSIGVGPNMTVAKIATGTNKPRGITKVGPRRSDVRRFLAPLPVRKLNGVGPKTAERLLKHNITTLGKIQRMSIAELWPIMGRSSPWLRKRALGIDDRAILDSGPRIRKSISKDRTFMKDVMPASVEYLRETIVGMSKRIAEKLEENSLRYRTVTLKLRYSDFSTMQRSRSIPVATDSGSVLVKMANDILGQKRDPSRPVRLIGLKVSGLVDTTAQSRLTEFV